MGFVADRPDPDTVYVCMVSRQLFLSFLLAYSTLPQFHIQTYAPACSRLQNYSRNSACLDLFKLSPPPKFKKNILLGLLKAS